MREERPDSAATLDVESSRFGSLHVERSKIIRFVRKIPGFEGLREFVLLDHDREGVFKWLQSVEDPDVAFLLTFPGLFRSGYTVPIEAHHLDELGASSVDSVAVFVMVSASRVKGSVSLNLRAPVLLNAEGMLAMQFIVDREDYECRYMVELEAVSTRGAAGKSA